MNVFDTFTRTAFQTLAARRAFAVIDDGHVVYKVYCARRTVALALAAGYATRLTVAHNVLAAALRRTRHIHLGGYGHAFDEFFGAGLYAQTATAAQIGIYMGVAFAALYCAVRTGVHTTAAAHTTHPASLAAACKQVLTYAVAVTLIFVLVATFVAAAARNYRNRRFGIALYGNAQNVGNFYTLVCGGLSAGIKRRLAFYQRFGKAAAPGITARAAIGAGKTLSNFFYAGVFLYLTKTVDKQYKRSQHKRNARYYGYCNTNIAPLYLTTDH